MTELYIDNKNVILPADLSITICMENPYFSRTSTYSLEVELPMPANHHVFGFLNRLDVAKSKTILPAVLRTNGRIVLDGSAVVLRIDDKTVAVQLASGNAEFNILTNTSYIDELDLGETPYPPYMHDLSWLSHDEKKKYYGSIDQTESVWLPVLYGSDELHNGVCYKSENNQFNPRPFKNGVCVQPYLLTVIRRILTYYGYTEGENYIDSTWMRNLYVVNALQTNRIAKVLPHWSVSELFDEIEKLTGVITLVDESNRTVSFIDINEYYNRNEFYYLNSIFENFESEINTESDSKDVTVGNVGYQLSSKVDDGYNRLDSLLFSTAEKKFYLSHSSMVNGYNNAGASRKYGIFGSENRWYINYSEEGKNDQLKEVHLFGDIIRDETKEGRDVELKITPALIQSYNIGTYLYPSNYIYGVKECSLHLNVPYASFYSKLGNDDLCVQEVVEGSEVFENTRERASIMEVAISTGEHRYIQPVWGGHGALKEQLYAMPYTDYKQTVPYQSTPLQEFSLSLENVCANSIGRRLRNLQTIHSNVVYTISFLATQIPKLNQVFIIQNKRYVAKKIEFNVNGSGMDGVMEGTFYRID